MKLYIYDHCPFCCRARMAAGLKGIPVDLEIIMEGDTETPIRLMGKRGVPILQKGDGTHMAESIDIVDYLDSLKAPLQFKGAEDLWVEEWCVRAWKPALRLFIPRFTQADFPELSTPEARAAYLARETKAFGDIDALMSNTAVHLAEMGPLLEELEERIAFSGDVSRSDFKLFPILRCLSIVKGIPFGPATTDYVRNMASMTGVPDLFDQAR